MSAVARNLTPLLTCPTFWFWHAIGAFIGFNTILYPLNKPEEADIGAFSAPFFVPIWSAFVAMSMLKDLLRKQFTFCLPGYRDVLRRALFILVVAVCLITASTTLAYPGLSAFQQLSAFWSSACFAAVIFVLVALAMVGASNANFMFMPLIISVGLCTQFSQSRLYVQQLALFFPALNTALVGALGWILWKRLGSVDLARRLSGSLFLSLQASWNSLATGEFAIARKVEALQGRSSVLYDWFVRRGMTSIRRQPALTWRRHLTSTLYAHLGGRLPNSWAGPIATVLFLMAVTTIVGYVPPQEGRPDHSMANLVCFLPSVIAASLQIPLLTTMLLPAGRRERFWSALIVGGLSGMIALVISALLFLFMAGIGKAVPGLVLDSRPYTFHSAHLGLFYYPLLPIPLMHAIQIVFRKWTLIPQVFVFLATAITLARSSDTLASLELSTIFILLGIFWGIFAFTAYCRSFRWDLSPQ